MKRKLAGVPIWGWLVGVGGGGIAFFVYRARKNASAAAAAAAAAPGAGTAAGTGTLPNAGYQAANYGAPDNNLSALGDVLSSLAATQAPATTTTTGPSGQLPLAPANLLPLSGEVITGPGYSAGPGYQSGTVQGNDGNTYSTVATLQAAQALFAAGSPVYYQPALGSFAPVTSQTQFDQLFTKGGATTWIQNPTNMAGTTPAQAAA